MNVLQNKLILITGATSGIGKALTTKLLQEGAKIAFCGRSESKLNEQIAEYGELGINSNNYLSKTFDNVNKQLVIEFIEEALFWLQGIDILINCAGANTAKANVVDIKTEDLEYMIALNLVSPFVFMKEIGKKMIVQKEGLIVNIQSTVCLFSNEGIGSYTASKAGFDALTGVFRKEMRKHNVRVCSVYPGGVNTAFRTNDRPDYLTADEVADAVINLFSADKNVAIDELVLRPFVEMNFR